MDYKRIEKELSEALCKVFDLEQLPDNVIFVGEGEEVIFDSALTKFKKEDIEFGLTIAYEDNEECNFLVNLGEVKDFYKVFRSVNRFNCYTSYDLKCFVDDDNILMISSVYNSVDDNEIDSVLEDFIDKLTQDDNLEMIKNILKDIK